MKIISGGQTGADRGALEAALLTNTDYGGWIPAGRRAEDGGVPRRFDQLKEAMTDSYSRRTLLNVKESDMTVIFHRGTLSGGSLLTLNFALKEEKPVFVVNLDHVANYKAAKDIHNLLNFDVKVLNVAGCRESKFPGIQQQVQDIMVDVLEMPPW